MARVEDAEAEEWARANAIDVAFLLVPTGDPAAAGLAEKAGYRLVDVRVTLDAPSAGGAEGVRPHRDADVARLRAIARTSHDDTRFYADRRFPRDRCDELYDTWIRRSCEGWADVVLVADREGDPAGYVSVHRRAGAGSIGLIGVDEGWRGRGVGEALVRGALAWCASAGLARCTVVTQGRNIAAQRLFQRCGFRTTDVSLWFHRWFT